MHIYTAHRGWLGVVTGISAASTRGVIVLLINNAVLDVFILSLIFINCKKTASTS